MNELRSFSDFKGKITWAVVLIASLFSVANEAYAQDDLKTDRRARVLWYKSPAKSWLKQALPLGNGRLGGMAFGGTEKERIQFNVDSFWTGSEGGRGSYQTFGDLWITLGHTQVTDYRRELDVSRAVHSVAYKSKGATYSRTYFVSHPAQVMVLHFSADTPGAYTGSVSLVNKQKSTVTVTGNRVTAKGNLKDWYSPNAPTNKRNPPKSDFYLDFESQLLVKHKGGAISATTDGFTFKGCDSLTVLLGADTDFLRQRNKGWKGEHPHARITKQVDTAAAKSVEALLAEHIADYQSLYNRCDIDLGATPEEVLLLPTDERKLRYMGNGSAQKGKKKGKGTKGKPAEQSEVTAAESVTPDPDLEELVFQFGRYLMISCSRPGSCPANLQGLWNDSIGPQWSSDYHTNINVQMNYWFVDRANLSECYEPYYEWLYSVNDIWTARTKSKTGTPGWTSLYPGNGLFGGVKEWKQFPGDGAFLCQNLYDHFAHTQDMEYLRTRAYPLMKGAVSFWEARLKKLDDGTLVAPNGKSPELGPRMDGVSYDQQLIWDLFNNTVEASEILGVDEEYRKKIAGMRDKLLGPKIGKWGQLQEWMVDRDSEKCQHRHVSHMMAVHPGRQITPLTTPKLAEAARVSMRARGVGETGWSRAQKINIWARLHDGEQAHKMLSGLLGRLTNSNLFMVHPLKRMDDVFQIDGNFGYPSGICEMLVQSHTGIVHFLPALPKAWPNGKVKGMRVRGGFTVDFEWKDGKVTTYIISSPEARPVKVLINGEEKTLTSTATTK